MYIGLGILGYIGVGVLCSLRWSYLFGDRTTEATIIEVLFWPIGVIYEALSQLE